MMMTTTNERARLILKKANEVYERILFIVLILLLLIVIYMLYDTWYVYDHAVDKNLSKYKPTADNPGVVEDSPITDDYVAWLTVDDTNIDYPVMQGTDNTKYLNLDPYGRYSLSGSIYLDSRNAPGFTDEYSLVYGHHMEYGKMFGALDDFLNEAYLKSHKDGTLIVGRDGGKIYKLRPYASMRADAKNKTIFDPDQSEGIRRYITENAEFFMDYPELADKKILGLSTCAEGDSTERILVFCYIYD